MADSKGFWERIRPNAEWETVKWGWAAARSSVISFAYWLLQSIRHVHVDWIGLAILFTLCMILGYLLFPRKRAMLRNEQENRADEDAWNRAVEDVKEAAKKAKLAGGQAALLWHFAADAKGLIVTLESTWHHWNNAGEALIHPLNINNPKNFGADGVIELINELRDFKILYASHIGFLKSELPDFRSAVSVSDYPSDREYSIVLSNLREHAARLDETAQQVWDSERTLL